ncbi:RTA1-domain-containing protein [Ophiobolus disseminans]|uniref:RTA1-domain-containing protein n=1 Tax=Ophiobolus disseminans TaxID=1469910 RepID=A0A6A6ZS98_9PLEO|nr:RTA1-domain-containing protein [Ophiobolus disseminans]
MSDTDSDMSPPDTYPANPYAGQDVSIKCTWKLCGINISMFEYRPLKAANLAFAVLFGICALAFLLQGFRSKKWLGFTIAMAGGCLIEVAGYVGRYVAYEDLWSQDPFLIQVVCLTIAPAFLAAGIYLCLKRIVIVFGKENSRISPRSYPRFFIACDFVSLVLQGAGGGLASTSVQSKKSPKLGNNLMKAGLIVQVVTLLAFMVLALDFGIRTIRRIHALGTQNALSSQHANLRKSIAFRGFLIALAIATVSVFTRCVFRVAELSQGWEGPLMKKENLFIGFEGVILVVSVVLLAILHPSRCIGETDTETLAVHAGGKSSWYGRKKRIVAEGSSMEDLKSKDSGHVHA